VHVWKVPLPLPEETIARLNEWLSPEERERITRFHFAEDRARNTSARGALRAILAAYLDEHPRALTFGYGPRGKPFPTAPAAARRIEFNLSHCTDLAVIGVASSRRVGIDVEAVREIPEMEYIVERYLNNEEGASIAAAAGEARTRLFLQFWTRREASAKARGLDLSAALSDLHVPLYPRCAGVSFGQEEGDAWSLKDLELDPSHIGTVCMEGETCDAVLRDFERLLRGFDH
jgi:4'-phosphopantetheinyl transferase